MLSFAATLEALRDAGLYPPPEELKEETGLAIGGGAGGLLEAEEFYKYYLKIMTGTRSFPPSHLCFAHLLPTVSPLLSALWVLNQLS